MSIGRKEGGRYCSWVINHAVIINMGRNGWRHCCKPSESSVLCFYSDTEMLISGLESVKELLTCDCHSVGQLWGRDQKEMSIMVYQDLTDSLSQHAKRRCQLSCYMARPSLSVIPWVSSPPKHLKINEYEISQTRVSFPMIISGWNKTLLDWIASLF